MTQIQSTLKRIAQCQITPSEAGKTVAALLTSRFTYHTPDEWSALLADGRVLVNGCAADSETRLDAGDTLEYLVSDLPEPEVCRDIRVLYEDDALVAVNKPAPLPCHPGGPFFRHTLWAFLRDYLQSEHIHLVHRLDRETSGIVLAAKSAEICAACRRQFDARTVNKRYLAAVEGLFPDAFEACGFLEPDTASPVRKKRRLIMDSSSNASRTHRNDMAETRFRRLAQGPEISLIEAIPVTGRLHQIRATLCSLGFPVVGDKIYGRDDTAFLRFIKGEITAADRDMLRLDRQALHAAELTITHPLSGQPLKLKAPLPDDLERLLALHLPSHA